MNVEQRLSAIRDLIQQDVGKRGLARDPADNLLTAFPDDFANACRSIAETTSPVLGVVTGFPIPAANPVCCETDGPLGAVFLARALTPLGIFVKLAVDPLGRKALQVGLRACRLQGSVPIFSLLAGDDEDLYAGYFEIWHQESWPGPERDLLVTHYVALERVGPSHTEESLREQGASAEVVRRFCQEVPDEQRDRCHTMRGRDITNLTRPAHLLFDELPGEAFTEENRPRTIGIGDGGNEIGMGKIPWDTIRRNIPNGGLIACRVPADHLIVAGVSNWGAYALAAGVALLRGQPLPGDLFDSEREREILRVMVEQGLLVDGATGQPTLSVDGLSFDEYVKPLQEIAKLMRE